MNTPIIQPDVFPSTVETIFLYQDHKGRSVYIEKRNWIGSMYINRVMKTFYKPNGEKHGYLVGYEHQGRATRLEPDYLENLLENKRMQQRINH